MVGAARAVCQKWCLDLLVVVWWLRHSYGKGDTTSLGWESTREHQRRQDQGIFQKVSPQICISDITDENNDIPWHMEENVEQRNKS